MAPRRLRSRRPGRRSAQRGNGLVFALLGLLVSAIAAVGTFQGQRLQARHEAGNGEATILDALRGAANNAILESIGQIQGGAAFTKNGTTVTPVNVAGELVWRPTIAQLVGMGYLPAGWSATVSTLNAAPYAIDFKRVPAGCLPAACDVEGHVILEGPIRGGSAASDGAVIGPILTRIGADSGVSLPTDPTHIEGFGNTWSIANPVAGQPSGVVGVRIGTVSSALGQFVRIGDLRDPNLAGNLTVAGNTLFGNGTTRSEFRSALQVDAQPIDVRNGGGNSCVTIVPDGVVDVRCAGTLNATTGTFSDAGGNASTIAPGGVVTTGSVVSAGGLSTPTVTAFGRSDPNAIAIAVGDFEVKGGAGSSLLRVSASGDAVVANDLVAAGAVQARQITLTSLVGEGDACGDGQVAMMASGGLATCQGGRYRATTRYARLGGACNVAGQFANDSTSADSLVCRGGYYASVSGLMSSRVYMSGFAVRHGDFIPVSTALPNGCPATASPTAPEATIFLLPQSDAMTAGNTVLNRNAQWNGSGWTISMTDGTGAATASVAVAEVYCTYP